MRLVHFFGMTLLATSVVPAIASAQGITSNTPSYGPHSAFSAQQFANAKSVLPLVSPSAIPRSALLRGNGLPASLAAASGATANVLGAAHEVAPDGYGTYSPQAIAPYTTARSSADYLGYTPSAAALGVTSYPWRAAGKLYFTIPGSGDYVCSASLIRPGIVVTAAHCVAQFGARRFYSNWQFLPGTYDAGTAPYGTWTPANIYIATSYYNGTDTCYYSGVACNNDIAIMVLNRQNGNLPRAGWYGYGWNGYSYVSSFGGASLAHITQLGYPVAFDYGYKQERTDGVGSFWAPTSNFKNTLLGSAQTGGSSGGPWMVNFGAQPLVLSGASLGNAPYPDVVIGVTSWGYTSVGTNTQGSSFFGQNVEFPNGAYYDSHNVFRGSGNIGALVAAGCSYGFDRC